MRLLLGTGLLALLTMPLAAQSSETGEGPDASPPRAQPVGNLGDPGATQDAEAAREKLLKAADQLDNIEANAESTKASVDGLKSDLARLSDENAALKAQVSTLQDTVTQQQAQLDKIAADRAKERQALIDEVSALVARPAAHHPHADAPPSAHDSPTLHPPPDDAGPSPRTAAPPLAPPADSTGPVHLPPSAGTTTGAPTTASSATDPAAAPPVAPRPATVHPRKGYYHVVEAHETLSLICEAYRDHGVEVTVAQIRRANGLTAKSELKVGQKLFIPQPST